MDVTGSRDQESVEQPPRCSIVIPVHNRAALTRQCLNTLLATPPATVDWEIIVVDDASTDNTQALLARYDDRIRVVTHTTNTGFSGACNDGAALATGEYLVFLNNDTVPQPGWLDALVRYAETHPRAAVVGSKLLFPDGTIQHAGVVVCQDRNPRHVYAGFPGDHPAVNKSRRFQIVTGACMLIRKALFEEVNGFDTAFVNGYEDVDLCLRLGELGQEIHYCHESVLYHLESVSRDHRGEEERRNGLLMSSRWAKRVRPDDLQYYADDGLLGVNYHLLFPVDFKLSPLLGLVDGSERDQFADRLLSARAQQVNDLLKDNIRLNLRVQEAEFRASLGADGEQVDSRRVPPTQPVSIILPVFNAFDQLVAAVQSVIAQTDLQYHTLIVIDDASSDPRVRTYLASLSEASTLNLHVLYNETNSGFPRSVNRGIRQCSGDVLLLNSDTVVTPRWLEKLQCAAYSRTDIASVTPFSNNATICSIPRFLDNNAVPDGFTIESFADFVDQISLRTYPEIPTAVGFCMYMTRKALDALGEFDEERFGKGYGEENDWCMRALKQGYIHILDDATYIYHQGSASFLPGVKEEIASQRYNALSEVHPEYLPMIRRFCSTNPLRPLHDYIVAGMRLASGGSGPSQASSWRDVAPVRAAQLMSHGEQPTISPD
jgi:GT2 family glycosyltransferase